MGDSGLRHLTFSTFTSKQARDFMVDLATVFVLSPGLQLGGCLLPRLESLDINVETANCQFV